MGIGTVSFSTIQKTGRGFKSLDLAIQSAGINSRPFSSSFHYTGFLSLPDP